ncbi:MAG: hypothetical protein HFE85_01700 [Clostridiales bacterium]|nr:hypothetical protein [Clostridiales bacterium]
MKLLSDFLKIMFSVGTVAAVAVQCCAGAALFPRLPSAAVLLFCSALLLTAGTVCYFFLRRRRLAAHALLFSGAVLSFGAGIWLMAPPVGLPLCAFGWFHLSALIPPLLAAGGECFAKVPHKQTAGSGR